MEQPKLEYIDIKNLISSQIRDYRPVFIKEIKEAIKSIGFNPSFPLSVIPKGDGTYFVADGNHRLKAIQELNINIVPCLVYPSNEDIYSLAVRCNYAVDKCVSFDVFDWLEIIRILGEKGNTQEQIAKKLGADWTREKVGSYTIINTKIVKQNLELAKQHQFGRFTENVKDFTNIDFKLVFFTDIKDLDEINQKKVIQEFINSEGKLKGGSLQQRVKELSLYESLYKYAEIHILNKDKLKELKEDIYKGIYKTQLQLESYLKTIMDKSKNKVIFGNCLDEIHKLQDNSIALLITDPPYGIDYVSNRQVIGNNEKTIMIPITADQKQDANKLFDEMLKISKKKLLKDAHLYVFCSWKNYSNFETLLRYNEYTINNVIIWDKGNHGAGDLKNYGDRYEMIIFAGSMDRKLNGDREDNIKVVSRIFSDRMEHPTEKPVELLKWLIGKSTAPGEYVLDPFMGAGNTLVACLNGKDVRNHFIGIEIDERYYKIAMRKLQQVIE